MASEASLAARLERAYALLSFECADVMEELYPDHEAEAISVAGGVALFAGAGSPLTQAHGLGFDGPVDEDDLDELEEFFGERQSPTIVEVCSLAHPSLMDQLAERGYLLKERKNILIRDMEDLDGLEDPEIPGLELTDDAGIEWAEAIASGFLNGAAVPIHLLAAFHTYQHCPSTECILALIEGNPAGGGALALFEETAILFSTSVLPEYRGLGIQKALVKARLLMAAREGCDIATVWTAPDSTSQRNLERAGFEVVYQKYRMIGPGG